jgi:hypothetical protein
VSKFFRRLKYPVHLTLHIYCDIVKNELTEASTMKRSYRIESWRHDVSLATVENLNIEAETPDECDRKAVARMNELSAKPEYSWDGLRVLRIDMPAVAEKVTFLANNGRQ